ncbi:putative cadmium-transporting ATPase [Methylibium sp. T29]|nr:putative cadmium-transporting ATPase [Methylibium sp. T29]EWS61978.1 putative cadmium-transporting ATPase [Methylibium sp. T29-B]
MTEATTLRLDLPLVLPDVDDAQDRCVSRLIDALSGRPGISQAHVIGRESGAPQLCVHYEPATLPLARVRELVHAAGAELTERFAHLVIRGGATLHARAARSAAEALRSVPGVLEADVSASGTVRIEYDRSVVSESVLLSKAEAVGVRAAKPAAVAAAAPATAAHVPPSPPADEHAGHDHAGHDHAKGKHDHAAHDHAKGEPGKAGGDHDHAHGGPLGEQSELIFAALSGALLLAGWLIERFGAAPGWLPTACYVAAYFFGGYFTLKEAIENLRAKRFEIDTLMLVAAVGAAALGKWAEGALLLFLFSLGHSLEHYAMGRARKAIEALSELAPDTAVVRRDGSTKEVAVAELQLGDVVIVKPNERLPADGVVVVGTSSVNQAPVTGESVPVDKRPIGDAAAATAALAAFDKVGPESRVFAGTINGAGASK